jgi:putative acetyltransferase
MIRLIRTDSNNKDFRELVRELDIDLKARDGEEHSFYAPFNKIETIKYVVVAYENDTPVGSGAIKEYADKIMEIKRMYVPLEKRGKGIASLVLAELEKWSKELGIEQCILETGKKQPEAIRLYKKNNYHIMPNFGQYEHVENSVCFEKELK